MIKNILIISAALVIATFINLFPNWYAWQHTPTNYVFTGQASWFDPWDLNVYTAAIRWGQTQAWLMENMYTSAPNQAIFYYPVYNFVGQVFKNAQPFLIFHLFAIVSSCFLIISLFYILNKIFQKKVVASLTLLMVLLGGGLGFLVFPYIESIDTHITSVTLLSALQRPHEALALTSYVLSLFSLFWLATTQNKKWFKITAFCFVFTLIFYPYYLLSFGLIALVFYLLEKGQQQNQLQLKHLMLLGLGGTVIAGLMYFNLSLNPSLIGMTGQTLTKPSLTSFILGYGVLFIPLIYQLISRKPKSSLIKFLLVWILVSLLLLFLPVGFARFYLRGLMIPLVVLAVLTIQALSKKYFSNQYPKICIVFLSYLLLILSITSIFIFSYRLRDIKKNNPWFYMSAQQHQAYQFLAQEPPYSKSVLSSYYVGNLLPVFASQRVYLGHLLQTPQAQEKIRNSISFYGEELSEQEAYNFLISQKIDYVYFSEFEKLKPEQTQLTYEFLTTAYENDEVIIYQVARE